ncbi:MAG: MBL fold metallo-hydrolase [Verrucomicrobiales bacterium]|nr:MBL fold metallo-hydrolase [Verrucomicrobiales bacterium]
MRLFLLSLLLWVRFSHAAADGQLHLYWIDSEGGGSTLLVTPAGESILIDCGNPGGRDAQRILHVAKNVAGLERLDHVVITHFHGDHFGGLADLATLMPIGTLYDKGVPQQSPDGKPKDMRWTLMRRPYLDASVEKRVTLAAADVLPLKQTETPLSLRCLCANQRIIAPSPEQASLRNPLTGTVEAKPVDPSDNANSLVLLLRFGDFDFFDGGDLTWNVEEKLVCPHDVVGPVDLYQVDHHGLPTSNHPSLIRTLNPTVSVMNNGPRKGTAPETLAALRSAPALQAMYQVHHNVRDEATSETEPERIANTSESGDACPAYFIHATVQADGGSFLVEVPSTGHRQTYVCRAP